MGYSCTDFTDDVLRQLTTCGALKDTEIPDDDPREQANLACNAIHTIDLQRKELHRALALAERFIQKQWEALPDDATPRQERPFEVLGPIREALAQAGLLQSKRESRQAAGGLGAVLELSYGHVTAQDVVLLTAMSMWPGLSFRIMRDDLGLFITVPATADEMHALRREARKFGVSARFAAAVELAMHAKMAYLLLDQAPLSRQYRHQRQRHPAQ